MLSARGYLLIASSIFALAGCQSVELPDMNALNPLQALATRASEDGTPSELEQAAALPSLVDMIGTAGAKVNVEAGFKAALSAAVKNDPSVIAAVSELEARRASARLTASGKDFNFGATVLGGVEDVTDETAGVAAILNANPGWF